MIFMKKGPIYQGKAIKRQRLVRMVKNMVVAIAMVAIVVVASWVASCG